MSNLNNPHSNARCSASATSTRAARERHFPRWKRAAIALTLVLGVALMACSMARTVLRAAGPEALVLTDILYMTGFVLVVLDLLYLPWVLVHMPPPPSRTVYERPQVGGAGPAAHNP